MGALLDSITMKHFSCINLNKTDSNVSKHCSMRLSASNWRIKSINKGLHPSTGAVKSMIMGGKNSRYLKLGIARLGEGNLISNSSSSSHKWEHCNNHCLAATTATVLIMLQVLFQHNNNRAFFLIT